MRLQDEELELALSHARNLQANLGGTAAWKHSTCGTGAGGLVSIYFDRLHIELCGTPETRVASGAKKAALWFVIRY